MEKNYGVSRDRNIYELSGHKLLQSSSITAVLVLSGLRTAGIPPKNSKTLLWHLIQTAYLFCRTR